MNTPTTSLLSLITGQPLIPPRSVLFKKKVNELCILIKSFELEPQVIIIDCDDTNNNAYGNQLQIEYNHYYGEYCFMPLHIYEGLSGKLITTILKPGRRSKATEVFSILKRVIGFIRNHWCQTRIIIRGDSHFCSREFMDWTDDQYKVNFITGCCKSGSKLNGHKHPVYCNRHVGLPDQSFVRNRVLCQGKC